MSLCPADWLCSTWRFYKKQKNKMLLNNTVNKYMSNCFEAQKTVRVNKNKK